MTEEEFKGTLWEIYREQLPHGTPPEKTKNVEFAPDPRKTTPAFIFRPEDKLNVPDPNST